MVNHVNTVFDEKFGSIRTAVVDGEILVSARDVALALGYKRPDNAVKRHCKNVTKIRDPVSGRNINMIPESDIYRLVMYSKLPNALRFQYWIVEVVIPSLRKYGVYMLPHTIEELQNNPEYLSIILDELEESRGKVALADAVTASIDSIAIRHFAKLFHEQLGMGGNTVFRWLRDHGYIEKKHNYPTQMAMKLGVLEIAMIKYFTIFGILEVYLQIRITSKGIPYFFNKIKASHEYELALEEVV